MQQQPEIEWEEREIGKEKDQGQKKSICLFVCLLVCLFSCIEVCITCSVVVLQPQRVIKHRINEAC
jgi:hypothetical protein